MPITTPLIVPSFSSRGFPQERQRLKAVTQDHFRKFAGFFDAMLVSAFDLHFGYVNFDEIPAERTIIVDSGGYESREWEDDSAVYLKALARSDEAWTEELMRATLARLPDDSRFVFVSYDLEADLPAQVNRAVDQLKFLTKGKKSFLIKEEPLPRDGSAREGEMAPMSATLAKLQSVAGALNGFDMIGITEKALGSSYAERISNLVLLRSLLTRFNVLRPIHVFGALDPLSVRVYSMAGADVFDGLSWLRFAYRGDQCVYLYNDILNESPFEEDHTEARDAVYARNYVELVNLQTELRQYRQTDDLSKLNLSEKLKAQTTEAIHQSRQGKLFQQLLG